VKVGARPQLTGCSVVVVASSAVVTRPVVVVVGATVLTGAGGGSVVVVVATGLDGPGADGGGGLVGLVGRVGRVGRGFTGRAAVAGPRAPGAVGAIPGAGCGPGSMVAADDPVLALEDAGPLGRGATVVGGGIGGTPEDLADSSGPKTAEATIAAVTAKVSPKATSSRRQGGRCSARWRGLGGGIARRRAF
jgi:hypothetical protein